MPAHPFISRKTLVSVHHLFRGNAVMFFGLAGLVLALAACSQTSATGNPSTATATTAATPTLVPAQCDTRYGSASVATLPDATYQETTVYAQIALPPQTHSYDDDASGLRVRFMCSAGSTASVSTFMAQSLARAGWQTDATLTDCGRAVIPAYGQPQCWKNGTYHLYVGINSNADWVVAYIDPAFL